MDVATVGVLGGMITVTMTIMLTVMIYLDRARRADMAAGFAAVNGRLDRFEESVDKRFERVDRRFEQIDRRFEQVDQRFEQVDRRFGQIDRRFEQVDQRFEQVDRRFGQIDQRFDGFTSIVVDLAKDVGEVKGGLAVWPPIEAFSGME